MENPISKFGNKSILLCEDDKIALDYENILNIHYPNKKICYFPAHDSLPFSSESSSSDILLDRSEKLQTLTHNDIIIITCNNLLKKFQINKDANHFLTLTKNQTIEANTILEKLVEFNHSSQANAYNKLEFSLRGDILDIYNSNNNPYRISFFDNVIETIKEFNPQTQLTFKDEKERIDIFNPNIELLEPSTKDSYFEDIVMGYSIYTINRSDIILKEKLNFLKTIFDQVQPEIPFSNYYLEDNKIKNFKFTNILSSSPKSLKITLNTSLDEFSKMSNKIYFHSGKNSSAKENEFLQKKNIEPNYGNNLYFYKSVISKDYLFDGIVHLNKNTHTTKKTNLDTIINFNDLSLGDAVVHQKHGIGRFISIDNIEINNRIREFIRLIYRGNDKLLLPIENLNYISRYGFDDNNLLLDKLGTNDWILRKSSVKKKIRFLANKLLKNAAKRSTINIKEFQYNNSDLEKFNQQFPFVETEDQLNSIEQSLNDLKQDKPSNRLICGDVGFGKTEVALRIACATYLSGFQFVIVVPTTLLAMQHTNTFSERFSVFNIKVACLSRFTSSKEKKEILISLKSGDIQILIATHSLFKKDIEFNNLGTLVIDEEQKFGVDQKEYLINKYPTIHLFSLSATPIPRTLQMSLLGLKDLSIIGTPPSNRISIRTYVQKYESVALISAIKNELERNGQIFIVVPRISHIPFVENEIKKLNIDLSYGVGHSKMKEKDIEDVFISFTKGEIQCLISTNIIESGIDIKNANTLIIFNSNLFGLSQLYQLRGRVGRSNKRAYAYLFHDSEKLINKTALKKLQVLANYENLGSNFQLANEDLEIRGAGNLLGDEQSGHVKDIGIELYQSMLKDEVERQKNNNAEIEDDYDEFEFDAFFEYYIPKNYISDDISRLIIYRKFTNSKNIQELKNVLDEIYDRYGNYPVEVTNLFNLLTIKIKSLTLGISKINIKRNFIDITFKKASQKTLDDLIQMAQENIIKMQSSSSIQIKNNDSKDLFYTINLFYKKLGLK